MKGSIDKAGKIIIQFDLNYERLEGPNGQFYLPCEICGNIQLVGKNTVSVCCPACISTPDSEDTRTFMDNRTFKIGQRVRFSTLEGWHTGEIIGFNDTQLCTKIQVRPDSPETLPPSMRWKLNPEAAAKAGKTHCCEIEEHGLSAGNFYILD